MQRFLLSATALITGLSAFPMASYARDWSQVDFTLGIGAVYGPDYEGSDDYDFGPMPIIEVNWADTVVLGLDGLRVNAISVENGDSAFTAGPMLGYDGGRDEGDNDALRGLGDIDQTIEGGGFIDYSYGPWMANLTVRTDLGDGHDGTIAELSAGYGWHFENGVNLSTGVATSWASEKYMQSYFGVDSGQASRSGYQRYDAGAGFKDVTLNFNASYSFDENWNVFAISSVGRLIGDAADSPIVKDKGSETQFVNGVGISYSF
ncbi:MipA/OmpV family protein [Aestuariispira ectoiniformans]|uniref:MipA/OmpV family protein n=1 Tax=Aestuariispira ectoiniformans TaxID=2775080 RepID=UPI00223B517A|nr:MipA/OmpV family protein [Aestuariispira ectoiniformans]